MCKRIVRGDVRSGSGIEIGDNGDGDGRIHHRRSSSLRWRGRGQESQQAGKRVAKQYPQKMTIRVLRFFRERFQKLRQLLKFLKFNMITT